MHRQKERLTESYREHANVSCQLMAEQIPLFDSLPHPNLCPGGTARISRKGKLRIKDVPITVLFPPQFLLLLVVVSSSSSMSPTN